MRELPENPPRKMKKFAGRDLGGFGTGFSAMNSRLRYFLEKCGGTIRQDLEWSRIRHALRSGPPAGAQLIGQAQHRKQSGGNRIQMGIPMHQGQARRHGATGDQGVDQGQAGWAGSTPFRALSSAPRSSSSAVSGCFFPTSR